MKRYATIDKKLGETPLEATERLRRTHHISEDVPLAYAGRLDPMATGTLLVLIGDECKKQQAYHNLDKEYQFQILFGTSSDTADILGLVSHCAQPKITAEQIAKVLDAYRGNITLPYPHFSSKTVHGKPLHQWTLEGRLNEITIPTKESTIYKLVLESFETKTAAAVYKTATERIEFVTPVTDPKKSLGEDFRREKVRAAWAMWREQIDSSDICHIATITCIASSGTYMRTLAESIAKDLDTCGLAWSIHRSKIGTYKQLGLGFGFWQKRLK